MRIRTWAIGLMIALGLTACSPGSEGTDAGSADTATTAQAEGEGAAIDVAAELSDKGFADRTDAIQTNAAYWLAPFQAPSEMSVEYEAGTHTPGNATCVFQMINITWEQGEPYAKHPIKSNSIVILTGYVVGADGARGSMLSKPLVVKFSELTFDWLAKGGADAEGNPVNLGVCGELTRK